MVEGELTQVGIMTIPAGMSSDSHTHPNEQAGRVLSGSFKLIVDGEERLLKEGDHYLIPPNVPDSAVGRV